MKIKEIIKDKKLIVRIILFAIAFAAALIAFSYGVVSLSENKEGYRVIDASPDEEAVLYSNDFTFNYYFSGRSGEIKELRKTVTGVYSQALCRAYKLLDPKNTYSGYNNLASLNESAGGEVNVGSELYLILKDAYERTCMNEGFNMFAGALYDYVNGILILEDPEEFDPLVNSETANRLDALEKLVSDRNNFKLEFTDDDRFTVRFSVSDEYRTAAEALEVDDVPVLNINLLRDAYILQIVTKALDDGGYTNGYISSKSGLTVTLSGQKGLEYCIYGIQDNAPAILDTVHSSGSAVYCSFKAFGFVNESMYYTLKDDGRTIYRNPYFSAVRTGAEERYLSLYSILDTGKGGFWPFRIADTVIRNLKIWSGLMDAENDPDYTTIYVTKEKTDSVIR